MRASASALSGIASLLDSINAPKAEAPVAQKETNGTEISESPEEKAKRLRKEARRKLLVSWKPETELVQIRIFQKEEAEDEARQQRIHQRRQHIVRQRIEPEGGDLHGRFVDPV